MNKQTEDAFYHLLTEAEKIAREFRAAGSRAVLELDQACQQVREAEKNDRPIRELHEQLSKDLGIEPPNPD